MHDVTSGCSLVDGVKYERRGGETRMKQRARGAFGWCKAHSRRSGEVQSPTSEGLSTKRGKQGRRQGIVAQYQQHEGPLCCFASDDSACWRCRRGPWQRRATRRRREVATPCPTQQQEGRLCWLASHASAWTLGRLAALVPAQQQEVPLCCSAAHDSACQCGRRRVVWQRRATRRRRE